MDMALALEMRPPIPKLLSFLVSLSHSRRTHLSYNPKKPILFSLTSSASSSSSILKPPNRHLVDYLTKALDFSKTDALYVASRCLKVKSIAKPQAVVRYFLSLGFSTAQIRGCFRGFPQILTSDVDNTLRPKIEFFQDLGLTGSELGQFFSKRPILFATSLEKKLVPTVQVLKAVLGEEEGSVRLLKVLKHATSMLLRTNVNSRLLHNIKVLESHGIVGSRLAMLLRMDSKFFTVRESYLRSCLKTVSDMGFSKGSKMFVHALYSIGPLTLERLQRKAEIFQSFGFSKEEYVEMIKKTPLLARVSEGRSKRGLDFYLNTIKFSKEKLVRRPVILMLSIEKRALPRLRVLEMIKSEKLSIIEPSFAPVLFMKEDKFLKDYVYRFESHQNELLAAYRGCVG